MKIPNGLRAEFIGYMESASDDDLPDGAWFQVLEDAAEYFAKLHGLKADANDLVHYYLAEANK